MSAIDSFIVPADKVPGPGYMKRVEAFGERILVANVDGVYYAASDTCTHEDASLSNGALKDDCTVACPLHGSRFDLKTGEALDEPAETPLVTYRADLIDGNLVLYAANHA
ncbi:MAG: non-heme iron oxygenase ferredoxin subunit [Proteobacteria bacterium]|nr:MAG: non-heme iron oxygenase ferredoxin subunit [Pseudomonadota bacterium]